MIEANLKINENLIKKLKKLKGGTVKVGWFEGQNYDDGTPIATIARVQEYGATINVTEKMRGWFLANGYPLKKETQQIHIPERSFMRRTADNKKQEWKEKIEKDLKKVIEGNLSIEEALNRLGVQIKGDIQTTISEISEPPNASMTIDRKGFNKPLVDTGTMLQYIDVRTEE